MAHDASRRLILLLLLTGVTASVQPVTAAAKRFFGNGGKSPGKGRRSVGPGLGATGEPGGFTSESTEQESLDAVTGGPTLKLG
jgi:hypothetical protein